MSTDLLKLVGMVEAALKAFEDELGPNDRSSDYWHRRNVAYRVLAANLTETTGAKIKLQWDGARVQLGGFASTSTSGLVGALHNWMAAARRRAGQ